MTAPCFKWGAARSCKHREVEEPRRMEPDAYATMPPQRYGSGGDRRKFTRTLTGSPVHGKRLLDGIRSRLNG